MFFPRRFSLILLILTGGAGLLFGQTSVLDSLHQLYDRARSEKERAELAAELAWAYLESDLEQAVRYSWKTVEHARHCDCKELEIDGIYTEAVAKYYSGDNAAAEALAQTVVQQAERIGYKRRLATAFELLGGLNEAAGNFQQCLDYYQRAAALYEELENWGLLANLYTNIGALFENNGQQDRAREYYQRAKAIYEKEGDEEGLAFVYADLATVLEDRQQALEYLLRAAEIHAHRGNEKSLAGVYQTLGFVYGELGDYQRAKAYELKALRLRQKIGEPQELAIAFLNLGDSYMNLHLLDSAEWCLQQALKLPPTRTALDIKTYIYYTLGELAEKKGQYDQAFRFMKKAADLKDSTHSKELSQELAAFEARFRASEREKELLRQNLELEQKAKSRLSALFVGLVVLLVLGIGAWTVYQRQMHKQRVAELALAKQKTEAENLRQLDAMKSKFFANISHELRTPLTLIMAPLEEAFRKAPKGPLRNELELAYENSQKLLQLVDQILELSRLDAGKVTLEEVEFNLDEELRRIFQAFQSLARTRNIQMDYLNRLPKETCLRTDLNKLERILNNLLSNAVKFSSSGGFVHLSVYASKGKLQFEVADTGAGIPPEDLPHIFERYYQSRSGMAAGGTGIGLAMSSELARLLGGSLSAQSQVGRGSTFILQLPADRILAESKPAKPTPLEMNMPVLAESNGRKAALLLVEDDPSMAEFLVKTLSAEYHCLHAPNGREALRILQSQKVDLITSDVMMPEMDGFAFRETLNQNPAWRSLPFILLTARTLEEDKLRGFSLGVDDYITKPFSTRELKARIENLLENKKQRETYQATAEEPVESADEALLKRAREIVLENLDNPQFKVGELARALGYSQRQLTRVLRRLTGLSPVGFILEIRMQKAYALLQNHVYQTVAEVRYEVGIESPAYFTTTFKKRFGISPKELLLGVG